MKQNHTGTTLLLSLVLLGAASGLRLPDSFRPLGQETSTAEQPGPVHAATDPLAERFPAAFGVYFYGMYLLDKKTGFVRIELSRRPESGEYVVSTRSFLLRMSAGEQEESDSTDTKRYAAEAPHRLLEIEQIEVNMESWSVCVTGALVMPPE